jgi:dTDP-4-amino-4,6-dideoxygalactose transaminase
MKRVALLVPDLPSRDELGVYLERIDAARWYTNFGPLVKLLEARLASGFSASNGVPGVVSVANATLGLELALLALHLPARSPVLVPALTFVASATSILRAGYEPVFCDVEAHNWLLTPDIARDIAREGRIAAVMPVATYGCAAAVEEWEQFTEDSGIPVVIDAAGAYDNQTRTGRNCAVFSMHATKTLGAAEGGFAVTTDAHLLSEIRRLSNFGIDLSSGALPSVGTNAKLSEYHAAVALASLDGWAIRRGRRVALHRQYVEVLGRHCPSVVLQERPPDGVYSILPVLLPEHARAHEVQANLAVQGIETRRWYCPTLDNHAAFRDVQVAGDLRVSRVLSERLLALPFHPFLSGHDVDSVCAALASALRTDDD